MRSKLIGILIAGALLLTLSFQARGQEVASSASITELKEQIAKLLSVERDETTSAEVRNLNHNFLEERRAQLRTLLQKRINALRSYVATVGPALTAKEVQGVENSIRDLERDLQDARADSPVTSAAAVPARMSAQTSASADAADSLLNAANRNAARTSPAPFDGRLLSPP